MQDLPDLLSQLKDIHQPTEVAWWPLAPGWWIVAAVVIVLGVVAALLKRKRKPNRIKQAQKELAQIKQRYQLHPDPDIALAEVNRLLKRICIMRYGAQAVASLYGDAWLKFLDEKSFSNLFTQPKGTLFATALYAGAQEIDVDYLFHASDNWLTRAQ